MKRIVLVVLALLAWPAPTARASTLVVGFDEGTSPAHVNAVTNRQGASVHSLGQPEVVQIKRLRRSTARATEQLLRDRAVRFVEPVRTVAGAATPSPDQWALRNTGQFGGTPAADIDVERAWATGASGGGVPVGTSTPASTSSSLRSPASPSGSTRGRPAWTAAAAARPPTTWRWRSGSTRSPCVTCSSSRADAATRTRGR